MTYVVNDIMRLKSYNYKSQSELANSHSLLIVHLWYEVCVCQRIEFEKKYPENVENQKCFLSDAPLDMPQADSRGKRTKTGYQLRWS